MKQAIQHKLQDRAEQALRRCLEAVPFACLERIEALPVSTWEHEIVCVYLSISGEQRTLLAAVLDNGQPRMVRNAANALFRLLADEPGAYALVLAPYISPKSAEICIQQKLGYIDFVGNAYLSFDQVYIERSGVPNAYTEKRNLKSLYAPKAERVLRVLLNAPHIVWNVQRLATTAQVSLGLTSNVKKLLDNKEWLRKEPDGIGFALSEPDALLTEWATNASPNRSLVQAFYSLKSTPDNEYDLAQACTKLEIPYALTGLSGASRYANYVRYQKTSAYVDGDITVLAVSLGWKPVNTGANINILTPYDTGVFYAVQEKDNIRIASLIQVYLDLQQEKGRAAEAAAYLREEVIRSAW